VWNRSRIIVNPDTITTESPLTGMVTRLPDEGGTRPRCRPLHGSGKGTSMTEFKKGDKVTWNSSQGEVTGTVERKLTKATRIKQHDVAASPDNPEYLVRSDKTGAEAAHKPEALRKRP